MAGAMGKQEAGSPKSTPPEDWMVEGRSSTKRAEEEAAVGLDGEAAVAKRSKAAREVELDGAGARKTRLVKVSQEYIDWLKTTPYKPFRGIPQHLLDNDEDDDDEDGETLRDLMARLAASHQKVRDRDLDILAQYDRYGFAEVEVEVCDDETEDMAVPAVGN